MVGKQQNIYDFGVCSGVDPELLFNSPYCHPQAIVSVLAAGWRPLVANTGMTCLGYGWGVCSVVPPLKGVVLLTAFVPYFQLGHLMR